MIYEAYVLLMSNILSHPAKKSQGVVEYALVLGFVVVLISAIYVADFRGQIEIIFDKVVEAFP